MAVVRGPRTPREAHDADRPVSSLLLSQIERLQQVVREQIQTEGQAAAYIAALTKQLWANGARAEKGATNATRRTARPRTSRR